MTIGRYGGHDRRRSTRRNKKFSIVLEYEGRTHEVRTIDISEHGVQIPRRSPPPVGTPVRLTLTLRDETSLFEGVVVRHTKSFMNGVQIVAMGIDISTPEYQAFVKDKIIIA